MKAKATVISPRSLMRRTRASGAFDQLYIALNPLAPMLSGSGFQVAAKPDAIDHVGVVHLEIPRRQALRSPRMKSIVSMLATALHDLIDLFWVVRTTGMTFG